MRGLLYIYIFPYFVIKFGFDRESNTFSGAGTLQACRILPKVVIIQQLGRRNNLDSIITVQRILGKEKKEKRFVNFSFFNLKCNISWLHDFVFPRIHIFMSNRHFSSVVFRNKQEEEKQQDNGETSKSPN